MRRRSTCTVLASTTTALLLANAGAAHGDMTFKTTTFPLTSLAGSTVTGSVIDIHTQGTQIYAQERYRLRGAVPGTSYAVSLTAYADAACSVLVLAVPDSPTTTANAAGNASAGRTFPFPGPPAGALYLRWQVLDSSTDVAAAQTACVLVALD